MSAGGIHTIGVHVAGGSYDVYVGPGLLAELGRLVAGTCPCSHAHLVSDSTVAALYGDAARASLEASAISVSSSTFPAGEQSKTVATWESVLSDMAAAGLHRDCVVVALGGGVTGDIAGFAAASYLRGVRVVQVPTTLLAMVDSSVGGKTGVDLPQGKNLVGAFKQPELVVADVSVLSTLPDGVFADACGEVVKHAVLADAALFAELERSPLTQRRADAAELARIVAANVAIKRDVVEADETEQGPRRKLNLGHTLGHAVEAASGYALGHGSCVSIGLACMSRWAAAEGLLDGADAERIVSLLAAHGLPTSTDADAESLDAYMRSDKKAHGKTVSLVVPRAVGRVEVIDVPFDVLDKIASDFRGGA